MSVQERKKESTLIEIGIMKIVAECLRFVAENINFERSQDPKVAMGIGVKPEIVALRDHLSEMIDECYGKLDDPYYGGMHEALEQAIQGIDKLSIMKDGNS